MRVSTRVAALAVSIRGWGDFLAALAKAECGRFKLRAAAKRYLSCRVARGERFGWQIARSRLFQAVIDVTVENQRGVLARVASQIAEAACNIDSITTEDDRTVFTRMHMVLEVASRQHLARVMRSLRRLPDVKKLARARE